jgi:hypothetical protein
MSKVTSPPEKKKKSLALDRRGTFDSSDKGNRKSLPRAKARSHREERRVIAQELSGAIASPSPQSAEVIEAQVRSEARLKKVSAFRKQPDLALGIHIAKQTALRKRRG